MQMLRFLIAIFLSMSCVSKRVHPSTKPVGAISKEHTEEVLSDIEVDVFRLKMRLEMGRRSLKRDGVNLQTVSTARYNFGKVVKSIVVSMMELALDRVRLYACGHFLFSDFCLQGPVEGATHALILAGSGARNELSPYSDIDLFLVYSRDRYIGFKQRLGLVNLNAVQLHYYHASVIMRAIADKIGLQMCILASPDNFLGQLILKPRELAGLLRGRFPNSYLKQSVGSEPHILNALSEGIYVAGKKDLYTSFRIEVVRALMKEYTSKYVELLHQQGARLLPSDKMLYDIKKDLYRPVQEIAQALASYFQMFQSPASFLSEPILNTGERLAQLGYKGKIHPQVVDNMLATFASSAVVRIAAHGNANHEMDTICLHEHAKDCPQESYHVPLRLRDSVYRGIDVVRCIRQKALEFEVAAQNPFKFPCFSQNDSDPVSPDVERTKPHNRKPIFRHIRHITWMIKH
eukprot:TRINITY_DN24486_c0_g1_i1.p1 TRINITY_DN24486_c0_g1~~TRINITY_DN24486_c0_g1_i1.p1  ORF type:complete len:461 (+),score=45.36 TRINITY_DN24486_c0_g1_i1:44-1426(+)